MFLLNGSMSLCSLPKLLYPFFAHHHLSSFQQIVESRAVLDTLRAY